MTRCDVIVRDEGSVVAFEPLTPEASAWIAEHVLSEGWQWLRGSLVVDHHFAPSLRDGMLSEGLVLGFRGGFGW